MSAAPTIDIEPLLAPISADQPCGEDIAFSGELDAIARARTADDPGIAQGAWVTTLKEADWHFVASRCAHLIDTRSKDLKLAVWLAEASALTSGFRGLADALLLIAGLCERFWEHVHPLPDDGFEQRSGNLCWLAARLPRLMQQLPLTDGVGSAYSLADFHDARSRTPREGEILPDLDAARRRTSGAFYRALIDDTACCMDAIEALQRVLDARLGADGPSLSAGRASLHAVIDCVTPFARAAGVLSAPAEPQPASQCGDHVDMDGIDGTGGKGGTGGMGGMGGPAAAAPGQLHTGSVGPLHARAQALAQLRAVADFFRRTEPHSPVAYLADKAAAWGEQPLHLWLRSVVKDQAVCGQLDELLGVEPAD